MGASVFFRVAYAIRPPQPRVPQGHVTMLPHAAPRTDAGNSGLAEAYRKDQLPQAYLKALENTVAQLGITFGKDSLPERITELPPATDAAKAFHHRMFDAINNCTQPVTPARLCRLAEDILKPMAARNVIGNVLAQKAADMGVTLRSEALPGAVSALLLTKGQDGMTLVDVGNTYTARALVDEVSPQKLEIVLKNTALQDELKRGDLPTFHSAALTSLLIELKQSFGSDALPNNLSELLETKVENGTLGEALQTAISKAKTMVTPSDLRALAEAELTPVLQRKSLEQALQARINSDPSLGRIHPMLVAENLDTLLEDNPQLSLDSIKNKDDAVKLLSDDKVTAFLQQQESTMRSVEDMFLPMVSDEMKPLLKNYIRSLPFDSENAEESKEKIKNLVGDMATWRNITLNDTDPGLLSFCEKVKNGIDADMHHLQDSSAKNEKDNIYKDNIYTTMIVDLPRGHYEINGRVYHFRHAEEAIATLRTLKQITCSKLARKRTVSASSTSTIHNLFFSGPLKNSRRIPLTSSF